MNSIENWLIISRPSSQVLVNAWGTAGAWFCTYFFFSRYVLEPCLPRLYGETYKSLSTPDQRSFTIHHHWLVVKTLALAALYPYVNIMFRHKGLHQPISHLSGITNADFLSVMYMGIIASFAWEIAYRTKISTVSLIHHIAAIALSIWQISSNVSNIPYTTESNLATWAAHGIRASDQQFKIIMTYGVFEVFFESWMHICCIFHRIWVDHDHQRATLWTLGGAWVLFGCIAELCIMSTLWRRYWSHWEIPMKVFMVLLHFAFMAAQLHGARIGLKLGRKYRQRANMKQEALSPGSESNIKALSSEEQIDAVKVLA